MKTKTNTFTLKSNELGGQFSNRHFGTAMGFTGENKSPQLSWEHAPEATKSFAITMYDLDAPTGSGFWHWVVFNIPAHVNELPSDAGNNSLSLLPEDAIQSNTDIGLPGYVGPTPPEGPAHRYLITVHALNSTLELGKDTTPALAGFFMHFSTLAKASLLIYGEKK
jgi:Raf kinase inhibitor-like YbhB/YbcL family protein